MSSLLRRPGCLARYSKRAVVECAAYTRCSPSRVRNPSRCPPTSSSPSSSSSSSFVVLNAPPRVRTYATSGQGEPPEQQPPPPPGKKGNDGNDGNNGNNGKKKNGGGSGSRRGKEGEGEKEPAEETKYALSKEEVEEVDRFGKWLKDMVPPSRQGQVDEQLERFKREGVPEEVKDFMKKTMNSKTPSMSSIMKFLRTFNKYSLGSDSSKGQGQTGAKWWKSGEDESGSATTEKEAAKKEEQQESEEQEQEQKQQKRGRKQKANDGEEPKGSPFSTTFKIDPPTLLIWTILTYYTYRSIFPAETGKDITWQEFRTTFFDKGLVEKLTVFDRSRVRVELRRDAVASMYPDSPGSQQYFHYYFTIGSVDAFERSLDEAHKDLDIPTAERIPVAYVDTTPWLPTLLSLGPTLLGLGFLYFLSRRAGGGGGGQGGIFGIGKSRARKFNPETDVKVRFADVAGMDEAKTEIMEFVSFLKQPERFQRLGAKIPRGAILSGSPGTGKTLLAKATAGESAVPFFTVSGSEFVEMFVGVGPSRARDLFSTAKKNAPCIIFIDEIDAIGRSRAKQNFGGGNDERESTLNQILTEMDGFNTSEQVVVLAGTNRPDVLDNALLRPGRFDRHISLDKPTLEGRKEIFGVHLKKIVTSDDLEYLKGRLSALTPGFSGADIANCVNEAALVAARLTADTVSMKHFEMAIERVVGGLEKRSVVISPEEKRMVAYHEAGHAICGWFFKNADPLLKVSIIPRGQAALGYAQYVPAQGDTYLMTMHQLMDRMAMTLGGRISEELHFETVTSGASDDFNKVTRMATAMVTKFGMSSKIGHVYFDEEQQQFQKPFSEQTARDVDLEVRRIVDEAYKQCRDLLSEKKREIGLVAEELLSKEVLSRDDLVRLLGPRPFPESGEFTKYFGGKEGETVPPPPDATESTDEKGTDSPQAPSPA